MTPRQYSIILAVVCLTCGLAWAGAAPADGSRPLYVYCSAGDNQWVSDWPPIDSPATVDALFEWLAKTYGARRMYWRGEQDRMWLEHYRFRKENPLYYDWWCSWIRHLSDRVRTDDLAVRAARRHGMQIYVFDGLFEHAAQGDVGGCGKLPYANEDRLRLEHPEWCPVDRWGERLAPGPIELCYPEARKALIERYVRHVTRHGYDGICFYTYVENMGVRYPDEYGYNEPIVKEFQRRYGVDIRTQPFDKEAWYRLRGEYVTQFLRELHGALSARGKKLGMTLRPDKPNLPQRWYGTGVDIAGAGMIHLDWEAWVKEGCVDELMAWVGGEARPLVSQILEAARGKAVQTTFFCSSPLDPKWNDLRDAGAVPVTVSAPGYGIDRWTLEEVGPDSLRSRDWRSRAQALVEVGAGTLKADGAAVAALARDRHVLVRRQAIRTLGALKAGEQVALLHAALADPEHSVKTAAAAALAQVNAPGTPARILAALRKERGFQFREACLAALVAMKEAAQPALKEGVRSPLRHAREVCIRAAARNGLADSPALLLAALRGDRDTVVRYWAADGLGGRYQPEVARALLDALKDPETTVHLCAARVLGEMAASLTPEEKATALDALAALFQDGEGCKRTDADWGWRVAGNAMMAFGEPGLALLEKARTGPDRWLAWAAYLVAHVRQSPYQAIVCDEEEDVEAHRKFAPPFPGRRGAAGLPATTPELSPAGAKAWRLVSGQWRFAEGVLEQELADRGSAAILERPAFSDFRMTAQMRIGAAGTGVRAGALLFRATGTLSYYWLHLDAKNNQAILVRSTPANTWIELGRKPVAIAQDVWHTVQVECVGPRIAVSFDGAPVMRVEDKALAAGRVGFGTSQGRVAFRSLRIEGRPLGRSKPLKDEAPPFQVISHGRAAGTYQAFPDACRLKNGDILCVFYAGYGHVSLPNAEWPRGGRVCMVRSRDEGSTWSEPRVLYDGEQDDRDPHIAQMGDGTILCSFFSYWSKEGKIEFGTCVVSSRDGGATWDTDAQILVPGWACSAPVREMKDGSYLLGVYTEGEGKAWGGVIRSTDWGKTWSEPIPIGKEAGAYLDAETDIIALKDGTLFAALRSSSVNMHYATSPDLGLTWSPVKDIGFKGHCPHLTRLRNGAILLTQRLPATALYVSRDEAKTWQGPYQLDTVGGAYPSTVELKDGSVLAVYYEEGEGSAIRALRFRLRKGGIQPQPFAPSAPRPTALKQVICPTGPSNPRNGEGDIVRLKDGRLLLAYTRWTTGKGDDDAPADIYGRTSNDNGRTWGPDFVMVPCDAMNVMSVSFLRLRNGELMMVYGRRHSNAKMWFYARFSKDEGKTWSGDSLVTPIPAYQAINNARVIQLRGGRLLAPVFLCRGETWMQDFFFYDLVYYSDDNGRTWKTGGQRIAVEGCKFGADEPGLIELKDGRVMMIIRTDLGRIYRSFSSDGGIRWTAPEPMPLASPSSPATIRRIPSTGDLLMVWNNDTAARSPLTTAISRDEGQTWECVRDLEDAPDGGYCYASVTFVGKEAVLSYYERGALKVAVVDTKWFYQ